MLNILPKNLASEEKATTTTAMASGTPLQGRLKYQAKVVFKKGWFFIRDTTLYIFSPPPPLNVTEDCLQLMTKLYSQVRATDSWLSSSTPVYM